MDHVRHFFELPEPVPSWYTFLSRKLLHTAAVRSYSVRLHRGRFTLYYPASRLSCRNQRCLPGTRGHMFSMFSWTSGSLPRGRNTCEPLLDSSCLGTPGLACSYLLAFQTGLLLPTSAASVAFGSPDLAPQSALGTERRPDLRNTCELPSCDGLYSILS